VGKACGEIIGEERRTMADISTEKVTLHVSDGTTMLAYVARPKGADKAPGMMVFQEAFGLTPHIREIAERLAGEGYTAIAPELFHRTAAPGTELSYNDFPAVMPHYQAVTTPTLQADIQATYDWLQKDANTAGNRVGCMGFCLGGKTSYVACATVSLQAAISFYGGGIGPGQMGPGLLDMAPKMHAPIMMFWGGLDKHIPAEQTRPIEDALTAAGKDFVKVKISFADHAFMRNGAPAYNEKAAKLAWTLSKDFLGINLKAN
jgi:carboxymethylenebutenolidase